ncbi:uncharacterized protein LOC127847962 [Dreissena polymorpha]|uniref:uncharacterized protein LOC127847962 n=1 Tax=Dreissena polymorpha TaxID=45954 RepID=UPI00226446BE|nr:uncharacterized protein LOC127847962 [Dreissena polymorpha]
MSRVRSAMSVRSNGTGASVRSIRSKGTAASSKTGGKGKVPTVFEFACMACAREKNNVEATNYCTDCAENLCASCVKQHLKFPAMKDHKVLGKDARRNPDDASPPRDSPLECPSHPGKSADMYCADHDEVRCGACIAVNHRTCINVMLVQQVARGVTKTEEFKTVKAEIQQAKKNLVSLKKRNERGLTGIEKQKVAIVNKIKATRTRLEQVLDSLEQNTLDELEKACARGSGQLKDDIKVYDDIMASLDAVTGLFSVAKSGSEGEIGVFVSMKRAKKKIEESARVFAFSKSGSAVDPIKFIPDSRISGWLKSLRMFGTFSFQKRVYVGELVGKYNVHTADDMRDCDIFGSEFMKNGTLLLCDWDNKCVKMLDSQLNVVEALNVDGSPSNICVINPTDAAVTLPMLKTVQLIQLQPKMALKHTIKTAESCRGIACHNAQLFVVCGGFKGEGEGKVIVYSISGDLIRTVERNNAGQRIFSCPIAIALSGDGKTDDDFAGHVTYINNYKLYRTKTTTI